MATDPRKNDRFRVHKRKGYAGTVTERTGKINPPKSVTAARKVRKKIAAAAGVEERLLSVLTPEEVKQRIGVAHEDVSMLNDIAAGRNVPRNAVSILGAQKLKLSVAGLLTQNLNVTGSLTAALEQVQERIAKNGGDVAADDPQEG